MKTKKESNTPSVTKVPDQRSMKRKANALKYLTNKTLKLKRHFGALFQAV
ncbi:MAG: hypothetical protein WAV82_07360 [Methylobacter sp.]